MQRNGLFFSTVCFLFTSACGDFDANSLAPPLSARALGSVPSEASLEVSATCPWDPGFGQESCYQSDWWLEFSVADATTESIQVEVRGAQGSRFIPLRTRIVLASGHVKFTGGSGGAAVRAGSSIRLRATQYAAQGGHAADSLWFAYRQELPQIDCPSCVPTCDATHCGDDGCGGTCPCSTGDVCRPDRTCCHPNSNRCGDDGCGGTHPSCPAGHVCQDGACLCVPDCTGRQCGTDGCGGVCGTCAAGTVCRDGICAAGCVPPWDPHWSQTAYAGEWWAEYYVTGGTVTSVSLEVVGGSTLPLQLRYGKWVGGTGSRLRAGTSVLLHAESSTGATAQTEAFPYLVQTQPLTDPCAGTAPPDPCEPLARGMLSINFDDSTDSQFTLARAPLRQRNIKVTIYHVTRPLVEGWNTYMTTAQAVLLAQDGHEIGAHTIDHPNLVGLSYAEIEHQLAGSKQWLEANVGTPVTHFASPYGYYDDRVMEISEAYFASHRTVVRGLNFRGDDPYELKADTITAAMTPSEVCALIAEASRQKGWRILLFHRFTSSTSSDPYTYPIDGFGSILDCASATADLDVVTMTGGLERLRCPEP